MELYDILAGVLGFFVLGVLAVSSLLCPWVVVMWELVVIVALLLAVGVIAEIFFPYRCPQCHARVRPVSGFEVYCR